MNGVRVELVSLLFCIFAGMVVALLCVAAGSDTGWITFQVALTLETLIIQFILQQYIPLYELR
jgi:hypothetical protein